VAGHHQRPREEQGAQLSGARAVDEDMSCDLHEPDRQQRYSEIQRDRRLPPDPSRPHPPEDPAAHEALGEKRARRLRVVMLDDRRAREQQPLAVGEE